MNNDNNHLLRGTKGQDLEITNLMIVFSLRPEPFLPHQYELLTKLRSGQMFLEK
jgi:hypothetical protein